MAGKRYGQRSVCVDAGRSTAQCSPDAITDFAGMRAAMVAIEVGLEEPSDEDDTLPDRYHVVPRR